MIKLNQKLKSITYSSLSLASFKSLTLFEGFSEEKFPGQYLDAATSGSNSPSLL